MLQPKNSFEITDSIGGFLMVDLVLQFMFGELANEHVFLF